uniref:Apple domain-containing protein n=1 Tax=viral metagenome TaxID=1070528 RepID=A0A6C0AQR2_9ZZZZ
MSPIDGNSMNKQGNSIALNLETLNSEYKNLLNTYQQASIDYVNYLQQQSTNPCNRSNSADANCLAIIQNQAFWGVSGISQTMVSSPEQCASACAATAECSGATFNPANNSCILRRGDGSVFPTQGTYAIVSKGKKLLQILDNTNNRLTEINQRIISLLDRGQKINNEQLSPTADAQQQDLLNNYYYLIKERVKIRKMLKNYQETEREIDEGNIVVTKNYYTYILLFCLAIVVVFIIIKLSLPTNKQYGGGKMTNNILYIIFFIILVLLLINFIK